MFRKKANEEIKAFDFYYTELSAFAEYLEKQELEGFRLKEFRNNKMVFEKNEPRKIRYCAEIFKGSTPDEFIKACTSEGWEHVDTYNSELYIFRTQSFDAIDIMTDENEKVKVCTKRTIFQPGMWHGLSLAILYLFYFLETTGSFGITILEINVDALFALILFGSYLLITFIKLFDIALWRFTIFRKGIDTSLLNFKNTVMRRRIYALLVCICMMVAFYRVYPQAELFGLKTDVFLLCAVVGVYRYLTLSKLSFDKKVKTVKALQSVLVTVIVAVGMFASGSYIEKNLIENLDLNFSTQSIPITIEDSIKTAKENENSVFAEKTRFGQKYTFKSEDTTVSERLSYDIFVSNYPSVRQKCVDEMLKKYEKSGWEMNKVSYPDTKWDYYYIEKSMIPNKYYGFAVKDNTVFYLRLSAECEENFFDLAYEKLFAE